jgi:FkbM family methyltransferase
VGIRLASWFDVLRARMQPGEHELATWESGASRLRYRPESHERFIFHEVWERDDYSLQALELPAGAIIDIGAHIGAFVVRARALFPTHPIVAVEPVPDNFRLLVENIRLNRCRDVLVLRRAIMDRPGATEVYLDPANTAGHSSVVAVSPALVRAPALTLEMLLRRCGVSSVALLKIDCEGAEYPVILGSARHLWDAVANLVVEYHPVKGCSFADLTAFLTGCGFEMSRHKDGYVEGQGTALFTRPALR